MSSASAVRTQSLGEEIGNAVSHGLGVLLAIASLPILVMQALRGGGPADVVGASLFSGTAIVLYLVSTLYHALPAGRAKALFVRLDHAAIFLFIAGSQGSTERVPAGRVRTRRGSGQGASRRAYFP